MTTFVWFSRTREYNYNVMTLSTFYLFLSFVIHSIYFPRNSFYLPHYVTYPLHHKLRSGLTSLLRPKRFQTTDSEGMSSISRGPNVQIQTDGSVH